MLHFDSYKKALTSLSEFRNSDINTFNDLYLGKTYEEIIKLTEDEQDAFSDKLTKIEIENALNFSSLRNDLKIKENELLNNPSPNWELESDNHFIVLDEERSLFNEEEFIQVQEV